MSYEMMEETAMSSADPALVTAMKSMIVSTMAPLSTSRFLRAATGERRGVGGAPVDVV